MPPSSVWFSPPHGLLVSHGIISGDVEVNHDLWQCFSCPGGRSHPTCRGTNFARVDVFALAVAQAFGASSMSAHPCKLSSVCPNGDLPLFPCGELCGFSKTVCLDVVHVFFFPFHKYFNRGTVLNLAFNE